MTNYKKAEIVTQSSMDIKDTVNEIIERTGVVKTVKVTLPRNCLSDVLQALNRPHVDDEFTLILERDELILHLRSA